MEPELSQSKPEPDSTQSAAAGLAGLSRRALLRAGASASPVLLTLASGPVAATGSCVVASSFVSASVYKSRNPGTTNVGCVQKTAAQHCQDAKSDSNCTTMAPLKNTIKSYFDGGFTPPSGFDSSSTCAALYKLGLKSSGDNAILQRLVALSYAYQSGGSSYGFTKTYCSHIWNNRTNYAVLVGSGNGTWDAARLLAWLDYTANEVNLP